MVPVFVKEGLFSSLVCEDEDLRVALGGTVYCFDVRIGTRSQNRIRRADPGTT